MDAKAVVDRIFECLDKMGVPKMRFYEDCGITASAIYQWKNRKAKPTYDTIDKIAHYLNVMPGWLAYGFQEMDGKPYPVGEFPAWPAIQEMVDEISGNASGENNNK